MLRPVRAISAVCVLVLLGQPVFAAERPALVLVIAVDQLRPDYLERFRPWFAKDGFNRLLLRGARFPQARHRHAATLTCPGHAAIGTGHDPRETGIVGNNWYDVANARRRYCVEDARSAWVGAPATLPKTTALPASPDLIGGDFLGDRLKEKFPAARVVALSLKDRAAVPMGGRKADAVIWFVPAFGRFVTSSYYPARPSLLAFNETLPAFFARRTSWRPSTYVPKQDLARITVEDPAARFPHALPDPRSVVESPFGDELVLALARHAIRDLRLGRNPARAPDLLFLGLSALDYYGHDHGADSREVADGVVRLDRELESFFRWVDREAGPGRVLVFLTADHGATTVPEVARERERRRTGRDRPELAGRVDFANAAVGAPIARLPPDRLALEKHLASRFAYTLDPSQAVALEAAILRFEDPIGIYLNRPVLARRRVAPEAVKEAVRDWLRTRPGVRAAYTNTEIANGLPATEPLAVPIERAFRADRSPDVVVQLAPGWIFRKEAGSTHGQATDEDSRVPLLAWGPGVLAGSSNLVVSPLSIARTIATLYGFEAGAADAEVLLPVLGRPEGTRKVVAQ